MKYVFNIAICIEFTKNSPHLTCKRKSLANIKVYIPIYILISQKYIIKPKSLIE